MTEEELNAKEEELKAKEESLKAKEEEVAKREEDANALTAKMKEGYESQIAKINEDYEAKLKRREDLIAQLTQGTKEEDNTPKEIEALIKARKMQRLQ